MEDATVYSFGSGQEDRGARLGHDDGIDRHTSPVLIEALVGKKVVEVSAGGSHSMVRVEGDDDGGIYTFGDGAAGQLGHADFRGQRLPCRVAPVAPRD